MKNENTSSVISQIIQAQDDMPVSRQYSFSQLCQFPQMRIVRDNIELRLFKNIGYESIK